MAFTVTPTRGVAPYFLSAIIENPESIDGVNYVASVKSSTAVGSCPPKGLLSPLSPTAIQKLINGESINPMYGNVAVGSCRTSTLEITRVSDNVVIATANTEIDNV